MEDPTQRLSRRDVLIVDVMTTVLDLLAQAPETPKTRTLLVQARTYDQAVKHWTTVPPSDAQLQAMFELVTDLHSKVLAATASSHRPKDGRP